ncbi:bifunctional 3,4-dihydroxy-2-butanone-4-phosphate synthase/GTP cyclohydrolase II [Thermoleptolyngbya sp. C42_A2020_037]|uniref:bifunctional 3,4-dihydroxy-2-butanone-4-phosphate synthase/GTP cyclohydrolase II n=1 Tax=Thermoleptolyngbya sp. C42_A2020_037 TaxID=2747799 RepID=UPI0019FD0A79|nr:bifunctional 3,4-dihydroxy-2-butanone-4-phosphate synthase/GTP cyclohydrolase II [Thermoleptolyngbya sp. C42_A2020_037]MBF2084562.1 bifunctional 3,4-dihydroxy-2-butanone-4-phosphate synthase RibB/GTP cyclohydrolase II RibA [Thermoleptolyngbya sp. C42_A2020_037]
MEPLTPAATPAQPAPAFQFDSIESALADLKAGRMIVVVDDENRENEGDLVCAAQFATPDMINFMAVEARGLICLAMTGERLDQLDLPLMVSSYTDESEQTAFTVSIDGATHLGVTTGISAEDRARTIQIALNPLTKPSDLRRPGHIFPLRAKEGGVLKRAGHTEAGVDLARLAGLYPAGVICEIQNPDGSMARLPELVEYAQRHGLKLISIADLISYRLQHERFVHREAVADLPTQFGHFKIYAYRNLLDNSEHVAIVKGDPETFEDRSVLVRVHSECLTGDALGSLRCDCRMQLQAALKMIENAGAGVVVYLRQEGRGIGLINKLKAYSLQDLGLDTVEANQRLGFPADQRNYGMGAQILNDIGVRQFCLITNNPRKIAGLKGYGLEMVSRVPLLIEATPFNADYLATKAEKLGHLLLQTYLLTLAIRWEDDPSVTERYDRLEKLRYLAKVHDLLVQEEARPVAIALFNQSSLIVHLGFGQSQTASPDWFQQPEHPAKRAIAQILDQVAAWPTVQQLEFLVSSGGDPMTNLQVQLDRQIFRLKRDDSANQVRPSEVCTSLATQRIYVFSTHPPTD